MDNNIKIEIDELHQAFYKLNETLFSSLLPTPAILIQNKGNKKNILGWCSADEIWINKFTKVKKYEINIVAESLYRPVVEIIETLIHEMVHLYNLVIGVQDTSRSGTYHNKKFKIEAENHGLIVEKSPKIGYGITSLKEETKELILRLGITEESFGISRIDFDKVEIDENGQIIKRTKKKSSSRKYICPSCLAIARTSKELNLICGDCNIKLELEE